MKYAPVFSLLVIVAVVVVSGCTGQGPATSPPSGCTPNWQCAGWGACSVSGTQTRTCTDSGNCNTTYGKPAESQSCTPPKIATKSVSEMILQFSDLPTDKNWTTVEKVERLRSDMSQDALARGWQSGYYAHYRWIGNTLFDVTHIYNYNSIYPLENDKINTSVTFTDIQKQYPVGKINNGVNVTSVSQLSDPKIGDQSVAYRVVLNDGYTSYTLYGIQFSKLNVLDYVEMEGTSIDYEVLKSLATTAANKVG